MGIVRLANLPLKTNRKFEIIGSEAATKRILYFSTVHIVLFLSSKKVSKCLAVPTPGYLRWFIMRAASVRITADQVKTYYLNNNGDWFRQAVQSEETRK